MRMPSCELLTAVSVVGVSTMLFLLAKMKYITDLNMSICLRTMTTRVCPERVSSSSAATSICPERVSSSSAATSVCPERVSSSSAATSICPERVSSSAAIIGSNYDLLTEILVLSPVKTVVRFKSVSKHWSSLISSKFFTHLHFQNHGRRRRVEKSVSKHWWPFLISGEFFTHLHCDHHGLYYQNHDIWRRRVESRHSFIMGDVHGSAQLFICHFTMRRLVRVSLPSPIKKQSCEYKIMQSWNGLLLISMTCLKEENRIDYVVFNPTTKQYRILQLDGYRPLTICLICDPSKPEYHKVLMLTSITPMIYSMYDLATQEWSHNMKGGNPFTNGGALGFRISTPMYRNLIVSSIRQGQNLHSTPKLMRFPEKSKYDNYMFDSNEHINLVQLKSFPEENKLSFRVGEWTKDGWEIYETATLDFNFKNSSIGVRVLGMMREEGMPTRDALFLFQVPGQLLIYKMIYKIYSNNRGFNVLVDYRSIYVKDEWQFKHVHPFIHTFASV